MPNQEKLLKKIQKKKAELADLESKRLNSMSAIMESMLNNTEPEETEVKFFKMLSRLIEVKRENLKAIQRE